ncbi:MAG: hypothetical protein H6719_30505 [Sandaracinaceae bacterium]|nr:hypothetical protein [Sandaracinaceae bacterium]
MRIFAAILLLAVLAPTSAEAQGRSLDIERFRPTADRNGYLGIPGTRTPGEWAFDASLWTGYSSETLTLRRLDTDTLVPIVRHRMSGELALQLGILDRIAVSFHAPVVLWQEVDPEPLDAGPAISASAVRDAFLGARVRILGEGATPDHERTEGEGLAVQVGMTLPWGLEQQLAGEGSPQLEGRVIGEFRFLDFGVAAEVGYRHRFAEPRLLGVQFANEIFFGAAVQSPTFIIPNLGAILEVRVVSSVDQEAFLAASTAVEGDLGARWADGDVALTWMVGTGFSGGVGTPGFRGMFGLEFAPRTHDLDGDGFVDSVDQCERMPEDLDGFEDDDGCPDLDNDGDLVPDDDDRCPLIAADFDHDEDEDGCTDPERDRDDDGVDDDDDACPDDAEDVDGHEDEDGCPDPDDDGDGVLDADDACRAEPEDADGFQDEDGCPDPDDDGDGILDADDACPRVPEDRDGHDDADGCPEIDDDRDGVPDASDTCPDRPETINGVDDGDGCPDTGGRARWIAAGPGDPPPLRGILRFSDDGSIRAISLPSVDQLALHLIARWGSRWTITVRASEAPRQDALSRALIERGVPEGTFEVLGDASATAGSATVTRAP